MAQVNRREQVKELIATGMYTKAEIAEQIQVNASSVSSQMTYLRWMGMFIMADEDKKLRFVTKEEFEAAEEAAAANRKSKVTTESKTPQEQANSLAKTLKTQKAQYEKAIAKCTQVADDRKNDPADEDLVELEEEANANATLLRIKIRRNEARAAELPVPMEASEPEDTTTVEASDISEDSDDLL